MYEIKKATPYMVDDIVNIEKISFTVPWSKKTFLEALESKYISTSVLLEEDGTICGFCCMMAIGCEAELLNIAVLPEHRRKGYAALLLEKALLSLSENSVEDVFLEVRESNSPARRLYERFGFFEIGVRKNYYSQPKENAVLMQKKF